MASMEHIESFGYIDIPVLSDTELTAAYKAKDWADLTKEWKISMYLTHPGTGESIEAPSVTLSNNSTNDDAILNDILKRYSSAWKKLAEM